MNRYLTVVLRNQFNLFYRCGYTNIPKSHFLGFNGAISKETEEELYKVFNKLTPFEYEEEYLILEVMKEELKFSDIEIRVTDLISLYPLSDRSRETIESRFDPRIRLEKQNFDHLLELIEERDSRRDLTTGINAVSVLCNISTARIEQILDQIGEKNILNGLKNRISNVRSHELIGENYWETLLTYERYEYFPDSTLGYFYDAAQIFAQSIMRHNSFEGSRIHAFLEELNEKAPEIDILKIVHSLEKDESTRGFIEKNTEDGVKYYLITALFMRFKKEVRNTDDIKDVTFIQRRQWFEEQQIIKESFEIAVVLIGAFFGFGKFYDEYYNKLDLQFFKPVEEREVTLETDLQDTRVDSSLAENSYAKDAMKETISKEEVITHEIQDIFINRSSIPLSDLGKIIKEKTGIKRLGPSMLKTAIDNINGIEIRGEGKNATAFSIEKEPKLL